MEVIYISDLLTHAGRGCPYTNMYVNICWCGSIHYTVFSQVCDMDQ